MTTETPSEKSAEEILIAMRESSLEAYRKCLEAVAFWNDGRDVGVPLELVSKIRYLQNTLNQLGIQVQADAVMSGVREKYPGWNGVVRMSTDISHVGATAG